MIEEGQTCGTCRFFEYRRDEQGYCRRYPPTFTSTHSTTGQFAQVRMDSYCGEWAPFTTYQATELARKAGI